MNIFSPLAQLLAFLVELAMLASFVYAGFSFKSWLLKILVGVGLPVLVIMIWGQWLAPRANDRISMPWLAFAELGVFLVSAGVLYLSGHKQWGIVLAATGLFSIVLSVLTKQFS